MSLNDTLIEWTEKTWNPITGCRHGCPYCYARKLATGKLSQYFPKGFDYHFRPERLDDPGSRKKPTRIFTVSMGDILGEWVPSEHIQLIIDSMRKYDQHTYQILTKNPEHYYEFHWPRNCWLGATATNQEQWNRAIDALTEIHQEVKFISCEPLLEEIDPKHIYGIEWLIIGAQTGPQLFHPPASWVKSLYDAAKDNKVKVFIKDNLGLGNVMQEIP